MKYLSRVVWSEGMYMGPHHFQAQSRYFEDSIEFASSSLWFAPYGLIAAQIDEEALANGTAAVMHARGIFPDGLTFHMPESDPLPEARQVEDLFPVVRDKVTLLLAVPPHRPDGVNCAVSDNGTAKAATSRNGVQPRFSAETRLLHDETTGRDEKPVELGRKNIRLLLDTEDTSDLITLPVARIVRSATGRFALDPEFIPPCLDLARADAARVPGARR